MTRRDEPIQPMTLGNMRQNGVRGLDVTCLHSATIQRSTSMCQCHPSAGVCGAAVRQARRYRAIPNWIERRDRLPGGRWPMSLSAEQRRALEFLAAIPGGYTKGRLLADGFTVDILADLVREGLATAQRGTLRVGGRTIRIERYRVTDAGRSVLEG
jgi:hypothetical protein